MIAVAAALAAAAALWFTFRFGRALGTLRAASMAGQAAAEYVRQQMADIAQHHDDLHEEITLLRLALEEANRRLADTGVTITVEETARFFDIATEEEK